MLRKNFRTLPHERVQLAGTKTCERPVSPSCTPFRLPPAPPSDSLLHPLPTPSYTPFRLPPTPPSSFSKNALLHTSALHTHLINDMDDGVAGMHVRSHDLRRVVVEVAPPHPADGNAHMLPHNLDGQVPAMQKRAHDRLPRAKL
eukprot:363878-Chlamydomonas_euryale.AAC.9